MLGNPVASGDPDPIVAQDVIDETGKRGGARRLAGETVKSDPLLARWLLFLIPDFVKNTARGNGGGQGRGRPIAGPLISGSRRIADAHNNVRYQ